MNWNRATACVWSRIPTGKPTSRQDERLKMKPQTTLTKVLSALALAGILSICTATIAQAGPQPHLKTGMFGVARDQVARINAVHIGDPGL